MEILTVKSKAWAATASTALSLAAFAAAPTASAERAPATDPLLAYAEQNPHDFIGINALAEQQLGQSIQFSVSGVDGPVDAATADLMSNQAPQEGVAARAVPTDAFSVVGYWPPTPGCTATYMGTWNFRDDYVNGSAPDDFASIMFDFSNRCLTAVSTTYNSYYYDGERTTDSVAYLKNGGVGGAPIVGLRDAVSGFKLNVDHGHISSTVTRKLGCDTQSFGAQFAYDHNQDGGSAGSVSASFIGGLSIGYSGSLATMRKSTNPTYINC